MVHMGQHGHPGFSRATEKKHEDFQAAMPVKRPRTPGCGPCASAFEVG